MGGGHHLGDISWTKITAQTGDNLIRALSGLAARYLHRLPIAVSARPEEMRRN